MTEVRPEFQNLTASLGSDLALVERGVDWFAAELRERVLDEPPLTETVLNAYLSVLQRGGKRSRGGLTVCAYDMYGGDDPEVASRAAGIVEGIHANLLVLDDVSDRSDTRRGGKAAHVLIEEGLHDLGAEGALGSMAMDMAVNTSVGVLSGIQILLSELNVPPERALSVINHINRRLIRTGVGQIMDVFSTTGVPLSDEDILRIATYKTAHYSFELPLQTGALLAGGDEEEFPRIERYSVAAGRAFQLWDDVMGTFGDEEKMGKSAKSDLIEGKQTLMMFYALGRANDAERAVLLNALGNTDMTDEEFASCQMIIERTGARDRIERMARGYSDDAQEALADPPEFWKPERVDQLRAIASLVVGRST